MNRHELSQLAVRRRQKSYNASGAPSTTCVEPSTSGGTNCQDPPLECVAISLYVNDMSEKAGKETINGVPVTDEQIDAWVAEAEAGYDVEQLKKRGRGRPGRGAEPSQVVALRLTREEIEAVDARAQRERKSRSEVIREALRTSVA